MRMASNSGDAMEPMTSMTRHRLLVVRFGGRTVCSDIPVVAGIVGNAMALFDLMPFVARSAGLLYGGNFLGPQVVQDFVTSFGSDPAVGYGILFSLIFLLAIFQGISSILGKL